MNEVAVYDYIIGIERKLLLLKGLMKEENYTGRHNIRNSDDPNSPGFKDYQYLIEISNTSDKLFDEIDELLVLLKDETKAASMQEYCCNSCEG